MLKLSGRYDASLGLALVASLLVVFQRPLRTVVELAREVEQRYDVDLLPGLVVLVGAYAFHEYRKRQQARAAVAAAQTEAAVEHARADELERLVAFGRALGGALEPGVTRQVFWRHMPAFAREREIWMLTRGADGWDHGASELARAIGSSSDELEDLATRALTLVDDRALSHGLLVGDYRCFPMMVGPAPVGVVGVRDVPPLTAAEQSAVGAAVALLAIAVRNAQLLAQTRENSIRDVLTGCFNRAYALETLTGELKQAARTGRSVSVLILDIDQFKSVNDRYGHVVGDAMLAAVGAQLSAGLRASDVKCRYGGDEFLIVLPDTPLVGAERAAAAVTRVVAGLTVTVPDRTLSPTVSVGLTTAAAGELDPMTIIARADQALYRAKRGGRNRYVAAEPLVKAV